MIYTEIPENFSPSFETASCFCEFNGKFLMLLRQDNKPEGNKWGVPAGKVDAGESPLSAMVRELWEETGIIRADDKFAYSGKLYVRYPAYDFIYHTFSTVLEKAEPVVLLKKEHKDFFRARPHTSLKMRLVLDMDECIRRFYNI
ncbi:MAG: NUDIX hydrolase [Nanoarchaeota archaeon]